MAAIVLPDGQSWVVSGRAFRLHLSAMRDSVPREDGSLLALLDEYEAVKGMSLDLLDRELQLRLTNSLAEGAKMVVRHLSGSGKPLHKDLTARLDELRFLLRQQDYGP
jgi:hypothetical protein